MIPTLRLVSLLVVAALALPADLPAQPEKSQPPKKEKLVPLGAFGGKVLNVDADGGTFLLRVHGQAPELRLPQGGMLPRGGRNGLGGLGISMRGTQQDVIITLADNVKLRTHPKLDFDNRGKPKPFKPDPKDADRKYGGVKGSMEDLRKDVWVVAHLSRTSSGGKHVAHVVFVLGEEEKPTPKR